MTRHENGPGKPTRRPAKPPRETPRKPPKATEAGEPTRQRIAKLMARVGLCSRRDAEAWIVDGRVTLNGEVLTSPARDVGPGDAILVDGAPLPEAEKTRLFLFHKPRGLVTSDHDPEGRETVTDHLRDTWPEGPRVVTIGRLDINTEGLLLLTNDGGLARALELPATGWVRRYRVRAKGETDQGVLDRLRDGLTIDGVDYAGIEAKLDRSQGANCWLTMGLREGKNREIKRVLEHIGLEVNRLIRLSFGPFQLLDLPEGKVEEVKTRVLRDQLGEALAAEAGVMFDKIEPPPPDTRILSARDAAIARKRDEYRRGEHGPDDAAAAKPGRGPQRSQDATPRRSFDGKRVGERPERGGADRRAVPDRPEQTPVRDRPVAGTRKHVSTLRADEASARHSGPRTRIERAATTDRNDRTVRVERIVRAAPAQPERASRRGAGRFAAREEGPERPERGRSGRDHASPSAQAKRVRVARSGGAPERQEAPNRDDRSTMRRKPRGQAPDAPPDREESRPENRDAPRGRERAGPRGTSFGEPPRRANRSGDTKPKRDAGDRRGAGKPASRRDEAKSGPARPRGGKESGRSEGRAGAARAGEGRRSEGRAGERRDGAAGRRAFGEGGFGKGVPGKGTSSKGTSGKGTTGKSATRNKPPGASRPAPRKPAGPAGRAGRDGSRPPKPKR